MQYITVYIYIYVHIISYKITSILVHVQPQFVDPVYSNLQKNDEKCVQKCPHMFLTGFWLVSPCCPSVFPTCSISLGGCKPNVVNPMP